MNRAAISSHPSLTGGDVVRPGRSVLRRPPMPCQHSDHFSTPRPLSDQAVRTTAGRFDVAGSPLFRRHSSCVPAAFTVSSPARLASMS